MGEMSLLYREDERGAVESEPGFRFGVIGDAGGGDAGQVRVADRMLAFHGADPWSFVLSLGDNVYEHGEPRDFEDKFKAVYRPLEEAGAKMHCCLGNHDCDGGFAWAQVRDEAFGYVGRQDEYSFDACGAEGSARTRFICLNSCAWLEALEMGDDLEIELRLRKLRRRLGDREGRAWTVLYLHHPLHAYVKQPLENDFGGHGSTFELREILEPEIGGRVDMVLAGHDHFYQKTKPLLGAHHFVSGGGARARDGVEHDHPDVEFAALELHFMDFEVFEDRIVFQAINDQGEAFHSGEIERRESGEIDDAEDTRKPVLAWQE